MIDLVSAINEIFKCEDVSQMKFPQIIHKDKFCLTNFDEQSSDLSFCDFEYVDQRGSSEFGFYGHLAAPIGEYFIVYGYYE